MVLPQVIADEAGTTTEPEALCALTLARDVEHIVLVGDHRQLRPVVKNRSAGLLGLGRSLFERLATTLEECTAAPMDKVHYRCQHILWHTREVVGAFSWVLDLTLVMCLVDSASITVVCVGLSLSFVVKAVRGEIASKVNPLVLDHWTPYLLQGCSWCTGFVAGACSQDLFYSDLTLVAGVTLYVPAVNHQSLQFQVKQLIHMKLRGCIFSKHAIW